MKTTKLSNVEKFAIQGLNHAKKTSKEMAKTLDRSENTISKYLEELDKIHATIAKIALKKAEKEASKAAKTTPLEEVVPVVKPVVKLAVPKGQAKRTMITKTGGDKPGVAIMTSASSQVGDAFRDDIPKMRSRTARGHLYDNQGNKLGDEK